MERSGPTPYLPRGGMDDGEISSQLVAWRTRSEVMRAIELFLPLNSHNTLGSGPCSLCVQQSKDGPRGEDVGEPALRV